MSDRLAGKNVIVSGAATGIGQGIAIEAAREGARVGVLYRERSAEATLAAIKAIGGAAFPCRVDVAEEEQVVRLYQELDQRFGPIDGLVNNAAAFARTPVIEVTCEEWERLFRTNVKGYMLMAREAAKRMMRQGSGKMVNVSSTAALSCVPNYSTYGATKAAIINHTMSLATELAPHGIQANCLIVGHTETDTHDPGEEFILDDLYRRIPMGRRATCREIGRVTVFLLSEDSNYINGAQIVMDGGLLSYQGPTGWAAHNTIWGNSKRAAHRNQPPGGR
ncbi:MAG: SDR family oxidoreductase [Verrucomicrobiae bacterium]|nr:SDR family oxidoreductase [Verrucomicrobiae bacterium]